MTARNGNHHQEENDISYKTLHIILFIALQSEIRFEYYLAVWNHINLA